MEFETLFSTPRPLTAALTFNSYFKAQTSSVDFSSEPSLCLQIHPWFSQFLQTSEKTIPPAKPYKKVTPFLSEVSIETRSKEQMELKSWFFQRHPNLSSLSDFVVQNVINDFVDPWIAQLSVKDEEYEAILQNIKRLWEIEGISKRVRVRVEESFELLAGFHTSQDVKKTCVLLTLDRIVEILNQKITQVATSLFETISLPNHLLRYDKTQNDQNVDAFDQKKNSSLNENQTEIRVNDKNKQNNSQKKSSNKLKEEPNELNPLSIQVLRLKFMFCI